MKKIIICSLLLFFSINIRAFSLLDMGFQTRAVGMGNAFSGLCDDASALFYNPALIYDVPKQQVSAGYSSLYSMADQFNLSYLLPGLKYPSFLFKNPKPEFGISLGFSTLLDSGIKTYSAAPLGNPGDYVKGDEYSYYENLFMLGFGTRIKNIWMMQLASGFTLKYFNRKFMDFKSYGLGLDLAVNAKHKYFNFGLVLKNIFAQINNDGSTEPIPLSLRFGTLIKVQRIFKNLFRPKEEKPAADSYNVPTEYLNYLFNPVIDGELVFDTKLKFNLFTGIEAWFNELISLRLGYNTVNGFSFGGSVQIRFIRLDYCYLMHSELNETHKISGTVYF